MPTSDDHSILNLQSADPQSAIRNPQSDMSPSDEYTTPLYQQLAETYRRDILSYALPPGSRIDSIAEMQAKHRIGRDTAKRVLNLLAEEGYIVQRRGKGSFVASLGPKQKTWGLVFPFHSVQFEDLIRRVGNHADRLGRQLKYLCDYHNYQEEIRLVSTMIRDRYEAVIVIPTLDESKTWSFYSRLSALDSAVVLLDHTMTQNDFTFVIQSYDLGVVRAINYLLDSKPGGVAFVENEVWGGRNMVLEVMRESYLNLMQTKRLGFEPLILERAGQVRLDKFRSRGITGVFCCDEVSGIQTIGRLKEQGADIPRDLNIVTYGNTELARFFTPPITSVDPHNEEMASTLAGFIHASNGEAEETTRQYVVHPELIIRGT
ncbi:MAG: substrate-binding domain-containing protein [Candidatus Hydrogenedentes bacterium]|nr:substrate-binding domain-containing protein [Candidatus Hydrogenedentota bacterium]